MREITISVYLSVFFRHDDWRTEGFHTLQIAMQEHTLSMVH